MKLKLWIRYILYSALFAVMVWGVVQASDKTAIFTFQGQEYTTTRYQAEGGGEVYIGADFLLLVNDNSALRIGDGTWNVVLYELDGVLTVEIVSDVIVPGFCDLWPDECYGEGTAMSGRETT